MRSLPVLILLAFTPLFAQNQDEKDVTAAVQKLFDGMTAHDADAIRALLLPGAQFFSIPPDGTISATAGETFATRIGTIKDPLVERMWDAKVLVSGRMAQLWAPYDLHLKSVFSHCGVDMVTLFKTEAGWKIQTIAYTTEKTGCTTPTP